jgi:hypothetical protein
MKAVKNKLIKYHSEKVYCEITRSFGDNDALSTGFILKISDSLILLQESADFRILGYQIIPVNSISRVRHNNSDKTYHRILKKEGLLNSVNLKYDIDLTNWKSACKGIKKTNLNVISECEHPDHEYFCIGELKRVNQKSISIRYFDATGTLDDENTTHNFNDITKLSFDDHYANVFSKYTK